MRNEENNKVWFGLFAVPSLSSTFDRSRPVSLALPCSLTQTSLVVVFTNNAQRILQILLR